METLEDLFKQQINELYSIEHQLIHVMPVMIGFVKNKKFREKLKDHLRETISQKKRIMAICNDLDISPNKDCSKVMKQIVRDIGELIRDNLHNGVQDSALLAQSERIEHYEIASYKSALDHAKKLDVEDYIELLDRTLDEEYEAEEQLSSLRHKGHGLNHLRVT